MARNYFYTMNNFTELKERLVNIHGDNLEVLKIVDGGVKSQSTNEFIFKIKTISDKVLKFTSVPKWSSYPQSRYINFSYGDGYVDDILTNEIFICGDGNTTSDYNSSDNVYGMSVISGPELLIIQIKHRNYYVGGTMTVQTIILNKLTDNRTVALSCYTNDNDSNKLQSYSNGMIIEDNTTITINTNMVDGTYGGKTAITELPLYYGTVVEKPDFIMNGNELLTFKDIKLSSYCNDNLTNYALSDGSGVFLIRANQMNGGFIGDNNCLFVPFNN